MRLALILYLFLFSFSVQGQSIKEDINKGFRLKQMGNRDSSTMALLDLLPRVENQSNDSLKAFLYYHLHYNFAFDINKDSTLKYFQLADSLSLFLEDNDLLNLYLHMGNYHQLSTNYQEAQRWYIMVDSISLTKGHKSIGAAMSLGNLYHILLDCETALTYFRKALEYAKQKGTTYRIVQALQGIVNCAGDDWNKPPYKIYFDEMAEIILANDKINMNLKHATLYYGISVDKMIYHLKEQLNKDNTFNNNNRMLLMNALVQDERYEEALSYFNLEKNVTDSNYFYVSLHSIELAMASHEGLGNLDSAFHYSKILTDRQKKFFTKNNKNAIDSLQMKYNYSLKEKEALEKTIALEKVKRNRNIWILLLAALGIGGGLYYLSHNKWKDKLHKSQLEKKDKESKVSSLMSMVQGQEKERERIAKDIHDSLGSILSLAKAQVSANTNNAEAANLIDKASTEVRRISHNMMPSALEDNDLISAIEDLINSFHTKTNLEGSIHTNISKLDLSKEDSIIIYRIIEELCNNVLKHAQAKLLFVEFLQSEGQLTINVEDDGIGIGASKKEGFGLKSIRSRLEILNGEIDVASYEGKGTSVTINIPQESKDE